MLFADGGALTGEAGAAIPVAARRQKRVFGVGQTNHTLGRCRAGSERKLCVAVLQEVEFDSSWRMQRIDRHLVLHLNRNWSYRQLVSPHPFRISIKFALDASSESRVLDLHVCDDRTCIWVSKDVNAGQAHRLLEKGEHVHREMTGVALCFVARELNCTIIRGMFDAQNISPRSEVDKCSFENT